MHVLGIEHFANKIGQPGKAGDTVGLLLDADQSEIQRGDVLVAARTTEGATQTDPAGEQRETEMCTHENYQFVGMYSLIGNYHCLDCGEIIEPVEFHRLKGLPHAQLENGRVEALPPREDGKAIR